MNCLVPGILHAYKAFRSRLSQIFLKTHLLAVMIVLSVLQTTDIVYGQHRLSELATSFEVGDYNIYTLLSDTMETLSDDVITDDNILVGALLNVVSEDEDISKVMIRSIVQRDKSFILLSGTDRDGIIVMGSIDVNNDNCVFTGNIYLAEERILTRIRRFEIKSTVLHKGKPKTIVGTTSKHESVINGQHVEKNYEYTVTMMAVWNEVNKVK